MVAVREAVERSVAMGNEPSALQATWYISLRIFARVSCSQIPLNRSGQGPAVIAMMWNAAAAINLKRSSGMK